MDESLSQRLASILGYLEEAVRAAGEFTMEQAPEVVQQFLLWKMTQGAVMMSGGVIAMITVLFLVRFFKKKAEADKCSYGGSDWWVGFWMCGLFGGGGSILLTVAGLMLFLKIWIAPKVYLIEYIADLATGTK